MACDVIERFISIAQSSYILIQTELGPFSRFEVKILFTDVMKSENFIFLSLLFEVAQNFSPDQRGYVTPPKMANYRKSSCPTSTLSRIILLKPLPRIQINQEKMMESP